MSDNQNTSALRRLGANERGAPSGYNLDVSGTVGPDYLGQETVDVSGHPKDRPGVQSRLPESGRSDDPRIARMDTGEELPVLLSSNMRAGPIEGTQGTYTEIVEGHCARCGYDRLRVTTHTLVGEAHETCNACGAIQEPRSDDGYRMPTTDEERADRERDSGRHLTDLGTHGAYDMEPDTGYGPYISIVGSRSITRLRKGAIADLFFAMVDNDDIDLTAEIRSRYSMPARIAHAVSLLPERVEVSVGEDEQHDD